MFRPLVRSHRRPPRRGTAILITCFFLITIMMVTGLALVMYAAREKAAALAYQEAEAASARVAPAPEGTVNAFLSALIYDTDDDGTALQNSLRGHSITRGMYGSNPTGQPGWPGSTTPWAGVGLFHEDTGTYTASGTTTYGALTALTTLEERRRSRFVTHTAVALNGMPFVLDPEWTGNRGAPAPTPTPNPLPGFAGSRAGKSYVGKHSGVVYPDLKSFFLAARDPHTGEVVQPSFHREWLFGTLAPSNPNWTSEVGKLLTLRPRSQEHPLFPRVPPDADGVYRGDVQNLPGGYYYDAARRFVAKNDSLWMHIGLPPIRLADGRLVQPLVAPLVLPLDGGFDLAHHGNQLNGGAHESYSGHGSWAVNINPGIAPTAPTERTVLMSGRTVSRNAEFNPFAPGQLLPAHSGVAWTGNPVNFQLPTGNSMTGLPSSGDGTFTPAYGNFQNDNAQLAGHPAGYNSSEFFFRSTANPTGPIYPHSDLKRINGRYAYTPSWYNQAFVAQDAPMTFSPPKATSTYEFLPSPGDATVPSTGKLSYRLDPAHTQRLLFSPRAMGLDRPALAPNFLNRADGTALALPALATTVPSPPISATKPGALFIPGTPYPNAVTQNTGEITDFAPPATAGTGTAKQWYNAMAVLGSVNLNRPLADYRVDTTKPLIPLPLTNAALPPTDPANVNMDATTAALADKDRQALAKDIFARLIIATGAAAKVSFDATYGVQIVLPNPPTVTNPYQIAGVTAPATPEQYNALRYLAQLAVNIVDHIDNDDVSTAFQWNPTNPTDLPTGRAGDIADVANRVVFGVEKPRLVINEMYGEIANDPADKAEDVVMGVKQPLTGKNAHVRFWAELLNPTYAPHAAATGILGDGSVPLGAYQVLISRANRSTKFIPNNPAPAGAVAPAMGDAVGYLTNSPANARANENVLGVFDPLTGRPDATFNLAAVPTLVRPNAGVYSPPAASLPDNGIVLLRTNPLKTGSTETVKAHEFNPPAAGVWANAVTSMAPEELNSLGYTIPMPDKRELANPEFRQHVVLLQRLANPYQPFNVASNPYVTVDMMDYVPAFDAVIRANMDMDQRVPRPATPANDGTEYDPVAEATAVLNRFAVGKVQPLAGFSYAVVPPQGMNYSPGTYNQYVFSGAGAGAQNSMVLNQNPTVAPAPTEPRHTFGRHNGLGATQPPATVTAGSPATINDTIMLPFDWLPHLDRPLETAGDLFTVRDCKPYLLTSDFVHNNPSGLAYESSYAQWTKHNGGLTRALELLTVKSPALGVPHGGRIGGRVNANVMQDRRIAQGVWDAPATVGTGTRFDQAFVNDTVWEKLVGSRTVIQNRFGADGSTPVRVPVPNYRLNGTTPVLAPTVLEAIDGSAGGDRAFQPYGGPAVAAPAAAPYVTGNFAYTNPSVVSDGDTLLRADPATNVPYLTLPTTAGTHAHMRTEPLRKVMNNLTTVSYNYVVYLTIGYFDVKLLAPGDVGYPTGYPSNVNGGLFSQFGAEVYDQVPGDMRQKFMAVIDTSNMALNLNLTSPAPASGQPFFTALTATARPVYTTPPNPDPNALVTLTLASGIGNGSTYSIMADGQVVTVNVGDSLALGYGSDTQIVTVRSVGNAGPTVNQITVTGLTRPVWGGTCVSNVRPGYVGPQGNFNYDSATYKPVVPYVERLR